MTAIQFDQDYFAERIERNQKLADETDDMNIRSLHLEYVRLYKHLLTETVPA